MASKGGCFCEKIRFEYTGEPVAKALCHCNDCRKITGSTYSTNIIIPGPAFKLTSGTPKAISANSLTGNEIVSHFCGDCGSTLWRDGVAFGDTKAVKVGTMDNVDALSAATPTTEYFSVNRASWVNAIPNADQKTTMV